MSKVVSVTCRKLKFEKFVLQFQQSKFVKFCDLFSISYVGRLFYNMHAVMPTSFHLTVKVVTECYESSDFVISCAVNERLFQFSADIIFKLKSLLC